MTMKSFPQEIWYLGVNLPQNTLLNFLQWIQSSRKATLYLLRLKSIYDDLILQNSYSEEMAECKLCRPLVSKTVSN